MEFVELDTKTFRDFADKSPYKSFMQTPEIAECREMDGWVPYYFGVRRNNRLVAVTMVVAKPTFLGKSTFYAPGGPLMDFEDTELVRFFFKKLATFIKSHNGYVLHIDPYYEVVRRDRRGQVVKDGFDHSHVVDVLKNIGFRVVRETSQPKYLFVMDLEKRTTEQILADMKQNTRNLIHRAERNGVKIRELKKEELGVFKQITESTSNRRNFNDRTLEYYEKMYDLFHEKGEVVFLLAEVATGLGCSKDGAKEEETSNTPLSVAMFMTYGDEVIYLFSGSDEKYMRKYNAQYLIQWHMIQYAVRHKYKTYNFYGINGLPDPSARDYGIYVFKKGFDTKHGRVVELVGTYELPINGIFYRLHETLSRLKRLRK